MTLIEVNRQIRDLRRQANKSLNAYAKLRPEIHQLERKREELERLEKPR